MKILTSSEKKQLIKDLNEKFGIEKQNLNYLFFQTGKNKIRGYSGNLSKEEINKLIRTINIEVIGLYLFKHDLGLRLTLDATHLLHPPKNTININNKQSLIWMQGQELEIQTNKKGFVIIKNNQDFLGCGLATDDKIKNFVPKERRIRK